jgi:hypothetical protein
METENPPCPNEVYVFTLRWFAARQIRNRQEGRIMEMNGMKRGIILFAALLVAGMKEAQNLLPRQ